jgi:hypothetical protein
VRFRQRVAGIDQATLSPEQFQKINELLICRPMQLASLFTALYGPETMEKYFTQAIQEAKKLFTGPMEAVMTTSKAEPNSSGIVRVGSARCLAV